MGTPKYFQLSIILHDLSCQLDAIHIFSHYSELPSIKRHFSYLIIDVRQHTNVEHREEKTPNKRTQAVKATPIKNTTRIFRFCFKYCLMR